MGEAEGLVKPPRKRKEKVETDNSEVPPEKKAKDFCCRTFRQELRGSEVLKSLKRFISATKNSDDVVQEYLDCGGSLQEILSIIDVTASEDLTTALPVFETIHLILLRCQSADSKHHEKSIEAARNILRTHMLTIKAMLSMAVPKHKKVALKLLTAIATLDSSFANEIMNVVALSPTLITDLTQPSPEKESVRKSFILFVLSFLIEGNLTVLRALLDKKGFLSSIIPGLKYDEATTVNLTLSLFEDKILKNSKITKTFKLKVFNTQIMKSLFDLYDWKGPQGVNQVSFRRKNRVKELEINQEEKEIVTESVHSFLLLLCCSQKYGVAFYDKSLGTSDQLNNQLLLTVFESLPDPLKSRKVAEVLLKTIVSCPDLLKPVLQKLEPSFQPRNSKNWFQAMDFAENLLKAIDVTDALKAESETLTANDLIKVGKTLYGPVTLLKVSRIGSQKSETMEIRFQSLSLLTTIWRKVQQLIETFQEFRVELQKSLHKHILKSVLDAEDLLELWHTLCNVEFLSSVPLPHEKKVQFLSAVLESFHITLECQRTAVSSPLGLAADLLRHVELIKESVSEREFDMIQVKIVELVQVDIQSLTPSMELFEKSLRILLRSADESSLAHSSKILSSLNVFGRNNAEVDVWLLSYMSIPREHRASVADDLIRSLRAAVEETDNSEEPNGFLTPFLFSCVQLLKSRSSKPSKKDKSANFRQYINDVVIHLQFFYGADECLHDRLTEFSKVLEKSTLDFLKSWKSSRWTFANVLRCPAELDLVSWIADGGNDRAAGDVIHPENTNLLKLYSLFRIVVAYLTKRSADGELTDVDAKKLSDALCLFLSHPPEADDDDVGLISSDVNNKAVYQRRCLDCLFRNEHLLGGFDVFQKKQTASHQTTAVVLNVLMGKDVMKSAAVKRRLTEGWKRRFLKQLKSKLKKNKSIDGLGFLEKALGFFDYDQADVRELMEILVSVAELDLFVRGDSPSAWTKILSKFMKLHCEKEEFDEDTMRKLCAIMRHLSGKCPSDLEEMSDCFVYLLRKHPSHLLLIDNEFLDVILEREIFTSGMSTLGKLLLNDPNKVRHFLEILPGKLETLEEPRIAFSLLSTLVVGEDSLLDANSDGENPSVWKVSEITPETTPELYDILKAVYKKFEKNILRAVTGETEESIAENLDFTRQLMKLFLDKKKVAKMKKVILKGSLEPKLLCEAVRKAEESGVAESYLKGFLTVFCRMIRNEEGVDWGEYCGVVSEVLLLNEESSWDVVESPEWKEFAKLAVGRCFASGRDAPLLRTFRQLITAFYKPEESKDCALFFQMLIAHSQFLKVMLSDSPLKTECVLLFHSLIQRCPSQASPKHFPILLAAYSAGLSPHDTTLLEVLRLYERTGVAVSNYEPFVWGDTAVSHYSIGTSSGLSLWQRFNMRNVLDLLDGQRLELSLREFPINRGLGGKDTAEGDANVYDPAFLLPLFVNLLSPGAVVYSLAFIYKGGLAYTVRAMSSECKEVRLTASVVLTRFYSHLELSQNLKQKLVWMHFINRLRYGVADLSARPLPNITTLFLSRMTLELSRQPAEMYLPLQNFLLARSYFSFDGVPEFLPLFHSSETSYWKHRVWLLEVLRDGTKTPLDMSLVFHSMALKVIFCFYYSQLCDVETKKLILQVLERMLRVGVSVLLISEYGLLSWINTMELGACQPVAPDLVGLLATLARVVLNDIKFQKNKHSNLSHLIQILNVAVKLLPSVKSLKSAEVFGAYLKLIKECLIFFSNEGESDWFKLNRDKLDDIMDAGAVILGEEYDCRRFRKVPFYFRDFEGRGCGVGEDLKNCVFLFDRLADREKNKRNKTES